MSLSDVLPFGFHSSPRDGRPLLGSPAERSSVRSSPTTAIRGVSSKISKIGHSFQSSKQPSSFGCSVPSPLSPKSTSSHPSRSASGNLLISGSKPSIHRVTAATEQSEYNHPCVYTGPHFRCGEEFSSTSHPSSNNPGVSPMSSLPRLASTPSMSTPDVFQNKPTRSSQCAPLKDLESENPSWSRQKSNSSVSSFGASLPSSPMASQTSFRQSSSGCLITKSIQSLLRRGKTKQTKLGAYPSLPSLNANPKAADEQRVHKSNSAQSLTKVAILSSAYAHSEANSSCRSSSSVQSFHPTPRSPLVHDAHAAEKVPLPNCSFPESNLKSARSFYSTVDSDASYSPLSTPTFGDAVSCLPVADSTLPECQAAIFTGSMSVSNHLDFTSDHIDVKVSIANSPEKLTPSIEVTEESDEDEFEAEDILANLRSIAASKSPKGQSWDSDSPSPLRRNSTTSSLNSDDYSVDCSDTRSEFSFDAGMDEEDGPDLFPLPSWPTLSSTSQSPLNKKSSSPNIRSSPSCSISSPLKDSITA